MDPAAYARGSWAEFGAYLRRFGVQVGRDAFFATLPTIDGDEVSLVAAGADVSTADNVQCHSCGASSAAANWSCDSGMWYCPACYPVRDEEAV